MPKLGDVLYDISLIATAEYGAIAGGTTMGVDPTRRFVFEKTGPDEMTCWSYDKSGKLTYKSSDNGPGGTVAATSIRSHNIDIDERCILTSLDSSAGPSYLNLWRYTEDGIISYITRTFTWQINSVGRRCPCDPSINRFFAPDTGHSGRVSLWRYTTTSVHYVNRFAVSRKIDRFCIDTNIRHVFGVSADQYMLSVAYTTATMAETDSLDCGATRISNIDLCIDTEFRFLFSFDIKPGNDSINILDYNADGTLGTFTQVDSGYATISTLECVDTVNKIIVLNVKDALGDFYIVSYKYYEDKTVEMLAVAPRVADENVRNIDSLTGLLFGNHTGNVWQMATYKYYQEYVRDYSARAKPTSGMAPLIVNFKSTRTEGYE